MGRKISILDLKSEVAEIWDEIEAAVAGVIKSGNFILGPFVKEFEEAVAKFLGVKHAIGVNSGTDALVISMKAAGVEHFDEVITSPFTFFATTESINNLGAKPVMADIEPGSFNIDPAKIIEKITAKTKAIMPVHLFGHAADMNPILEIAQRFNLKVIEDTAQAFGAEYKGKKAGAIGDLGAFSFFPTKTLGAYGDGGLITTNDDELAELARILRVHGGKNKYKNEILGYNSRLDAIQASILSVKLRHIERYNDLRRKNAAEYNKLFAEIPGVKTPSEADYTRHVYHQYTIRVLNHKRDEVHAKLSEAGVMTMIYYPVPAHKLPVYENNPNLISFGALPITDQAADEVLSLPIYPQLRLDDQKYIVDEITRILS